MYILAILTFIFGLIIGSFLNVCIYRLPAGISIINPPSRCSQCKQSLGIIDLVPVFSYLFLRGQCRHCQAEFSPRYPLVELFCGLGFMLLFLHFGLTVEYLTAIFLFSGLVVCSLIDLDHQIIPDQVLIVLTIGGIPLLLLQSTSVFLDGLLGAVVGGGLLLLVAVLSKGGMGGGDVKLAAVLGLYLGWSGILLVFFIAFLAGSVVGLTWAWLKKKTLKTALPFGPFLSTATLIVLIWGESIINWYLSLF